MKKRILLIHQMVRTVKPDSLVSCFTKIDLESGADHQKVPLFRNRITFLANLAQWFISCYADDGEARRCNSDNSVISVVRILPKIYI